MQLTTLDAIRAVLKTDATLTPVDRAFIIACVRKGCKPVMAPAEPAEIRLVRWKEAARKLSCSTKSVQRLAKEGFLHPVTLPGRMRSAGVRLGELEALIQQTGIEFPYR